MSFRIDAQEWAEEQFSACELGDKRRTKRLIQVAKHVANHPSASFPQQMQSWGDLKAAYRLFDRDDVTFDAIAQPHWQQTRSVAPGRYLVLGDTTEIDFGYGRDIDGLVPIGNGSGRGFLLHNALMVEAESETLVGVAGQTIFYRKQAPKKETKSQRFKRERESQVWGTVIDQIGVPTEGVELVHVFDRGADDFGVFCHLQQNRGHWVVRAASMQRHILTPDGDKKRVQAYLPDLSLVGTYELELRSRPQKPARTAKLEVCIGEFQMPTPQHKTPQVKALHPDPIPMVDRLGPRDPCSTRSEADRVGAFHVVAGRQLRRCVVDCPVLRMPLACRRISQSSEDGLFGSSEVAPRRQSLGSHGRIDVGGGRSPVATEVGG